MNESLEAQAARLKVENTQLRAFVDEYAGHDMWCKAWGVEPNTVPCTCGYDAARVALGERDE